MSQTLLHAPEGLAAQPALRPVTLLCRGEMMRSREVAEALDVSLRTVWLWVRNGNLPEPMRIGRIVLWRRADIKALAVQPRKHKRRVRACPWPKPDRPSCSPISGGLNHGD